MLLHDHHLPHSSHGYSFRDQYLETEALQDWMGTSYDERSLDWESGEKGEKDFAEHPDSSSSSSSSYRNKKERKKKTSKLQLVGEKSSIVIVEFHS